MTSGDQGRQFDQPLLEAEVLRFWQQVDVERRLEVQTAGGPAFVFWEGPPTANGRPHIGHAIPRVMKDLFTRYRTMQGYRVVRKAGWDTHGLPVELEVEKELGLDGKDRIEAFGVERFAACCRQSVFRYQTEWERFTRRLGFWLDLRDPYVTCSHEYIESVWWAVKQFYDRGLVYRGHRVVPYCPRCGTPLSSHEVAQGYAEVEDPSVTVRLPDVQDPGLAYLVWTTTPWTLPANAGLAVNPKLEYVEVNDGRGRVVLVAEGWQRLLPSGQVVRTLPGHELVGRHYRPPFAYLSRAVAGGELQAAGGGPPRAAFVVVAADFVGAEQGTGLVHLAPAFGEDDMAAGIAAGLPFFQPVDTRGRFTADVPEWRGRPVKECDSDITAELARRGLLHEAGVTVHSYPLCWRCDTPLLNYARASWFIAVTRHRERLLELNASVRWKPDAIGTGRFGDFLEHLRDYNFSRERYWGTPLNIWGCDQCGHELCVGSLAELGRLAVSRPDSWDLHRPAVDQVVLRCPHCGGPMRRVPEVIDCWFDAGSMPFAQWHYPFEGREEFAANFPADFIAEAVDQTRGWFYTLLVINGILFDAAPYRSVLVTEFGLDERGQKMSKHKGNVMDPQGVMERVGADALRWYVCASSSPWLPKRFSEDAIARSWRKFAGTLWNTWAFLDLYARAANINPGQPAMDACSLSLLDRWIWSRLGGTIDEVREALDDLDPTPACRAVARFVDELSNWYVRRSRQRFWGTGEPGPDPSAFVVLYQVLATVARLLAPLVPFFAEALHQKLGAPGATSVHLAEYPQAHPREPKLEADMAEVMAYVNLGRAARHEAGVRVRQPLAALYLSGPGAELPAADWPEFARLMADELNVKSVSRDWSDRGPALVVSDGDRQVALDPRIDGDLRAEGVAREVINRLQRLRKQAGFEMTDRIITYYRGAGPLVAAIERHRDWVGRETLSDKLAAGTAPAGVARQESEIDGQKLTLAIELSRRSR